MNCKNCQTELEEGVTLCPNCGAENAEPAVNAEPVETAAAAEPEKTGLSAGKIALLVVLAVAAIAVVVSLVLGGNKTPAGTADPTGTVAATTPSGTTPAPTIPADGNPDDVTCKGSYTVSNEELAAAAAQIVGTVGGDHLTNEVLQTYYWIQVTDFLNEYYAYAAMFGLNLAQPLDTQKSMDGVMTWQQYFLDCALQNWYQYHAMSMEAKAAGFVLDDTYTQYLDTLPMNLEQTANSGGYSSVTAMLQAEMGPGTTLEGYMSYMRDYYLGYMYYISVMNNVELSDAEIEAYFDQYADAYRENGLEKTDDCYVDVRHILVMPTSASGASTYTEEEWAAAEQRANELLNQWLSGAATEESFAAMAGEYTMDPGSTNTGGLYENVYKGQMVEPFENWCFDAARQTGDYGIVRTDYGYHIMYFVRSTPIWYMTAREDMLVEKGNAFVKEILEKHPAEFDYSAIVLGHMDLGTAG